jgi:pyruvate,water dikinase
VTRRRYAPVAFRLPVAAGLLPRRLHALRTDTDAWWRATVFGPEPDQATARALLADALARFTVIMRRHSFASFICQSAYDQVAQFAARAGSPGAETRLVTGYGGMEETAIAADLWDVSRDVLGREDFVRKHVASACSTMVAMLSGMTTAKIPPKNTHAASNPAITSSSV